MIPEWTCFFSVEWKISIRSYLKVFWQIKFLKILHPRNNPSYVIEVFLFLSVKSFNREIQIKLKIAKFNTHQIPNFAYRQHLYPYFFISFHHLLIMNIEKTFRKFIIKTLKTEHSRSVFPGLRNCCFIYI